MPRQSCTITWLPQIPQSFVASWFKSSRLCLLTQLRRRKFIHQMVSLVTTVWFLSLVNHSLSRTDICYRCWFFSLMGLQARVIEAFFQGHKLVLRLTKMYDSSHGNHNPFKTFAQWYIGKPIGITTQAFWYPRWFWKFLSSKAASTAYSSLLSTGPGWSYGSLVPLAASEVLWLRYKFVLLPSATFHCLIWLASLLKKDSRSYMQYY